MSVEDVVISVITDVPGSFLLSEELPKEIADKLMRKGLIATGIDRDCVETAIRLAIEEYWKKLAHKAAVPDFSRQISRHLENSGITNPIPGSPPPIMM